MTKRLITKKIETRVGFSNEEVVAILMKAAKAPDSVSGTVYHDQDSFHGDLEIVWWETKQEEAE